jgi:hypothetical protein
LGWQFSGSQALDEVHVPFFGAFDAAWDDTMVARWSANPLGMLWPEMDAAFVTSGGGNGARRLWRGGRWSSLLGPNRKAATRRIRGSSQAIDA